MKLLYCIFGRCCMFCGKTVDPGSSHSICHSCAREIEEQQMVIPLGENRNSVAMYYFEGPARRGLHHFKYNGKIALGKFCGKRLAERYRQRGDRADVVTCVPRARDERPRLYNQSAVIARAMAKELGLPFDPGLLSKRKGMLTQPECPTHLAREENAKKSYRKGPSKRELTHLTALLVDDLYTSGSTANVCCKILKKQGAADTLIYTAMRVRAGTPDSLFVNFDRLYRHADFTAPNFYRKRWLRCNDPETEIL